MHTLNILSAVHSDFDVMFGFFDDFDCKLRIPYIPDSQMSVYDNGLKDIICQLFQLQTGSEIAHYKLCQ